MLFFRILWENNRFSHGYPIIRGLPCIPIQKNNVTVLTNNKRVDWVYDDSRCTFYKDIGETKSLLPLKIINVPK